MAAPHVLTPFLTAWTRRLANRIHGNEGKDERQPLPARPCVRHDMRDSFPVHLRPVESPHLD